MSRERRNAPRTPATARERAGGPSPSGGTAVERIRRRAAVATAEIELDDDDLRALADAGIDPDEVQAIARTPRDDLEVSMFDRASTRDDLEGLIGGAEYQE